MFSPVVLFGVVVGVMGAVDVQVEPAQTQYDGHMVVEAYPRSDDELRTWLGLTDDVWSEHYQDSVVLRIAPEHLPALRHSNLDYRVLHRDLQEAIDQEAQRVALSKQRRMAGQSTNTAIDDYLELDEYQAVVDGWVAENPEISHAEPIGESVEGRPIRALHVSGKGGDDKPVLMLLSGHHAREWLAHHATMCAVERLIEGYDNNDDATFWLDRVEIIYIPMGNPDGYNYTWTNDRLWRKNRGAGGNGVDLNRNWDAQWATASSGNPSSQTYHGSGPFSEPETQAYSELITEYSDRIEGFIDVHAFGSIILFPYGYTNGETENHREYEVVSEAMSDAMDGAYDPVKITDFVGGPASGSSADWVHDNIEDGLSFGFEVRGNSFTAPASQIAPTCDEIYPALLALMETFDTVDPGDDGSTGDPADSSGGTGSDTGDATGGIEATTSGSMTTPGGSEGEADGPGPAAEGGVGTTEGGELPMGTSGGLPEDDDSEDEGCGCHVDGSRPSHGQWGLWMLGLMGLGGLRRRRF